MVQPHAPVAGHFAPQGMDLEQLGMAGSELGLQAGQVGRKRVRGYSVFASLADSREDLIENPVLKPPRFWLVAAENQPVQVGLVDEH